MSKPDTLENQSSLYDDTGPIPEFQAGRRFLVRTDPPHFRGTAPLDERRPSELRAISEITDETDTDDRWEEIYRNIDDSRPHRKLFEEMY